MVLIDLDRVVDYSYKKSEGFINYLVGKDWDMDGREVLFLFPIIASNILNKQEVASQDMRERAMDCTFDYIMSFYEKVEYKKDSSSKRDAMEIAKSYYSKTQIESFYNNKLETLKNLSSCVMLIDQDQNLDDVFLDFTELILDDYKKLKSLQDRPKDYNLNSDSFETISTLKSKKSKRAL